MQLYTRTFVCAAAALFLTGALLPQDAATPKPPPDAAKVYDLALAEMRRAFELGAEDVLELPTLDADAPAAEPFDAAQWGPFVERAATALGLFEQATRVDACDFGAGQDEPACGYDDRAFQLIKLSTLLTARGRLQLAKRPEQAAASALTLLRHVRHVVHQPSVRAIQFGLHVEQQALALLRDSLAAPAAEADLWHGRVRAELRGYAKGRPTLRDLADTCMVEATRFTTMLVKDPEKLAGVPADAPVFADPGSLRQAVLDRFAEFLAPLRAVPQPGLAAIQAANAALVARYKKAVNPKQLQQRLPQLPAAEARELLAQMLALALAPDTDGIAAADEKARALLGALLGAPR